MRIWLLLLACMTSSTEADLTEPKAHQTTIIAHRGASGYRPEHTLEAYTLGVQQGAEFIEPDLVMTRDGVLIARHERPLQDTTNVADRLPMKVTKGVALADDLTSLEVAALRAIQPRPSRGSAYDSQFSIPTWEQILSWHDTQNTVQLIPELKHPAHLAAKGLDPLPPFVRSLREKDWVDEHAPIMVQCFEPTVLQDLRSQLPVRTLLLIGELDEFPEDDSNRTYGQLLADLPQVATFASAIGVHKSLLLGPSADPNLVNRAHQSGLEVHVYTFRDDQPPAEGIDRELSQIFDLKVDAIFTDFPDTAVRVRSQHATSPRP